MGTNYYWHAKPECSECGHECQGVHIGKSSGGWCFGLHVYPEDGIHELQDWILNRFNTPGSYIRDEYGDKVTREDMLKTITERWWQNTGHRNAQYLASNHAVEGPRGLMRHAIDPRFCIGHGEGTWDLMIGEFS